MTTKSTLTLAAVATTVAAALPALAPANTSHAGWPKITGVLLLNKYDSSRPLDGRPGHDPFGGKDPIYSCDSIHKRGACQKFFVASGAGRVMTSRSVHNELLGGHGSDDIHAGPTGDVLWGDYKPSGQPTSQHDTITGNSGRDIIYASHGTNDIAAGGGKDIIHAHYGHGTIDCGGGADVLYISRKSKRGYKITGCETISYKTVGF